MTAAPGVSSSVVMAMALVFATVPPGCAKTPVAAKAPPDPATDMRALLAAKASDRCVDEAPKGTVGDDAIVHVALAASGAYGSTRSGHVRAWDLKGAGVTVLDLDRVHALSPDGSTALTTERVGQGVRIEGWDLATKRRLGATTLEHGFGSDPPFTVAGRTALMRAATPPCEDCEGWQWRPPPDEVITWDLASGQTARLSQNCAGVAVLSPDGLRAACVQQRDGVVSWTDLTRGGVSSYVPAPEWWPPPPPAEPEEDRCTAPICERASPVILSIDSLQFAATGSEVYYTYRGLALASLFVWKLPPRHGWRLERWTPDPTGKGDGRIDRLAQSNDTLCAKLLAVSAAGSLTVLGGDHYRTTVRRAPRYEAVPLGGATLTLAAAISADGARILTGHPDGRMRLWDARTLELLVTSDP